MTVTGTRRNPMRPLDPNDVCPGWAYAIVLRYRESKTQFPNPKDTQDTLAYESTLGDAQSTLEMEAERLISRVYMSMRRTSKNRFYGSDGGQMYELTIVPIEDRPATESGEE